MSLIDEALKRAELEAARRDGLRGGAYPWVMEGQPRRRRGWVAGALVAMAVAISIGGVVWVSRHPPAAVAARSEAAGSGTSLPKKDSAAPKIEMETVEVAPPPKGQAVRAPSSPRKADAPRGEAAPSQAPKSPPSQTKTDLSQPERSASQGEASPASSPPGSKPVSRGIAEGRTYLGEVDLPEGGKISLEGIVYSETNPVALINGKVVPPGAIVEEFAVIGIQPDRVELRKQGLTIFVKLK